MGGTRWRFARRQGANKRSNFENISWPQPIAVIFHPFVLTAGGAQGPTTIKVCESNLAQTMLKKQQNNTHTRDTHTQDETDPQEGGNIGQ